MLPCSCMRQLPSAHQTTITYIHRCAFIHTPAHKPPHTQRIILQIATNTLWATHQNDSICAPSPHPLLPAQHTGCHTPPLPSTLHHHNHSQPAPHKHEPTETRLVAWLCPRAMPPSCINGGTLRPTPRRRRCLWPRHPCPISPAQHAHSTPVLPCPAAPFQLRKPGMKPAAHQHCAATTAQHTPVQLAAAPFQPQQPCHAPPLLPRKPGMQPATHQTTLRSYCS